ncbi:MULTISPECIES: hypothetical protein [unclassified Gordonia (in: high G+C Gram-positive bacteria)]|uniref:hypothetical protein n=1 Tax=unclassified Gordonia (in: high G+C Gram-positive bacteria) TaxID=2657482 RepID=UPI0010F603FF|nr:MULTISPECIES: hypothetical protein [unclassified Gordonia (in: high G+C Gram-positive bacteria)]
MSSPQQSYNTYGSRNDRAFARGRTQWAGMSIDEILDVLSTMEPGRAGGDVNTILQAIESVRRAAERMHAMFGDGMLGQASDAALEAGRSLSADLATTSETAGQIGDALAGATGILGSARGQEGRLRELQQHIRDNPEDAPAVRHEVDRAMTGAYSSPMIGLQRSLPNDPSGANGVTAGLGGGPTAGGSGAAGSGPDAPRGQAANTVDAGDFGRATPTAGPVPVAAGGPPPGGGGPGASSTPPGPAGPGGGPSGRGNTDGPDGLVRGGRATPESTTRGAAAPGTHRSGGADGIGENSGSGSGSGAGAPASGGPGVPVAMPAPGLLPPATAPTPTPGAGGSPTPANPAGPVAQRPTGTPLAGAPGGGRRPGADDDSHRAAPYLHTREHGAQLVGDMPLVGPPVIGDWIRQATPAVDDAAPAGPDQALSLRPAAPGDAVSRTPVDGAAQEVSDDTDAPSGGSATSKPETV